MPDDPSRVTISTYLPAEQRDRWEADADSLDMSRSEFVRAMVQAGRRDFSLDRSSEEPRDTDVSGSYPGGNDLKTAVLDVLRREGPLEWDELIGALIEDLETEVDAVVRELQDTNRIQHRGREGGYVVVEGDDGE